MRSKTLSCKYFNSTLFRKNLMRFWPLWGMASFLGSLFPLAILMEQLRRGGDLARWETTQMYYEVLTGAVPIISLIYAVLCAMLVWSYLYTARSVGLAHTLPIRREGLFVTNFLAGLAMMLIPYAVTGALCVLISLVFGGFEPVGLLLTVLSVLGESFFYFASATFAAFLTGNVFALPVLYFLLHFLAPLMDFLVSLFARGFLFGVSSGYSGAVDFLSPTVYLMQEMRADRIYEEVTRVSGVSGTTYTDQELVSVGLENFWLVGAYALMGVVLLALAWALYRRRHSERAGDVVATRWLRPVARYGVAALAAMLGGQALYALFWSSFQDGRYADAVPMIVCMIVAGTIGYYAASMLLEKSLRVFRGSWKGVALVAVGCAALCGVLRFDLLGVTARVPEIADVESVELMTASNTYRFYPGEEDELLEQVRQLHQSITADAAYYRAYDEVLRNLDHDEDHGYECARLTYTLKNGSVVERYYDLCLTRERMEQAGTADYLLDRLVNSEAMKAKRLHAGDERYTPEGGNLWSEARNNNYDFNSREAQEILEAVGRDAAAGNWGTYEWFYRNDREEYAARVELWFSYEVEWGTRSDWITIALRPEMTETIRCLLDMGALTEADLVTYAELYPEAYQEAVDDGRVPADVPVAYERPGVTGTTVVVTA